jgi:hypothetical protein
MGDLAKIIIKGTEEEILLKPREFKTGSTGFFGHGKLRISDEEKYQISVTVVLIGSKNKK